MNKKLMSMFMAVLTVMSASAIVFNQSLIGQTESVIAVKDKPKCSRQVEGNVCGGTLELSFTAYKETTDKKCPFCNGNGNNCKYEHCDNGKIWEWRSAYVCQKCKALYDVEEIQKQM